MRGNEELNPKHSLSPKEKQRVTSFFSILIEIDNRSCKQNKIMQNNISLKRE